MDRFLDSFQERPTPQKILIIVGVTALFLLVLAILYFITTPPRSNISQTQNTQIPQVTPIPIKITNSSPVKEELNLHTGTGYTVSYSSDWKKEEVTQVNQESVVFTSVNLPVQTYTPGIQIIKLPYDQSRLVSMEGNYISLGFTKAQSEFKLFKSDRFTGVLPIKTVLGKQVSSDNFHVVNIIQKGNSTFIIEYSYDGNIANQQMEKLFSSFLDGFSFTQ